MAFDVDKIEDNIDWNTAIHVDGQVVKLNKQATRWLGIWIDSSLSLKDHHHTMIKKTRNAQRRIRRLTGRVDRVAENVGRAQAACVQAVAMYGSELRWKGGKENSTIGRAENLQIISSSHHRLLQKHGPGQLMLLSGLRPAHSLLNNRGRRFALRMASLPEGGQAGQLVGTPSELGTRLSTCLVSPEGMK